LKYLVIFFFTFIFFSFGSEVYSYKKIKNGENLVITFDDNEGIIDWDDSGNRIVFTSSYNGSKNIYYLDLMNIKFSSVTKDFYTANYISELIDKKKIYFPITAGIDTIFECPKWSSSGNRILSIGTYSETSEIFYTNRSTLKTIGTGIKDVATVCWKSNSEVYFVKKIEPENLYKVNLKTKKDSLILNASQNILGISKQKGVIYLACNGGVLEYKKETKKQKWYKMNINGKTAWKLDKLSFIVKNMNGEAQIIDLNNGTSEALFIGDGDGEPALSENKKYVAFYSKFLNGIVIKKLNNKY